MLRSFFCGDFRLMNPPPCKLRAKLGRCLHQVCKYPGNCKVSVKLPLSLHEVYMPWPGGRWRVAASLCVLRIRTDIINFQIRIF